MLVDGVVGNLVITFRADWENYNHVVHSMTLTSPVAPFSSRSIPVFALENLLPHRYPCCMSAQRIDDYTRTHKAKISRGVRNLVNSGFIKRHRHTRAVTRTCPERQSDTQKAEVRI